jgi:hypothetical protein
LSDIICSIDGPLAPFGDAEQLQTLVEADDDLRFLYEVLLKVHDAAAHILDGTTLAQIVRPSPVASQTAPRGPAHKLFAGVLPAAPQRPKLRMER